MRIAITGASGFVGSAAVAHAENRGHEVIRIVRPERGQQKATDVLADLSDHERLADAASTVDAVLHCAASDDPSFLPVSKEAVDSLIRGLRPGGAFVMHSGSVVFGDTGEQPADQPDFAPPPALRARADFDRAVLSPERDDVYIRVVYGSLIFGGTDAAIPSIFVRAAMEAGAALYFGDGDQIWSSAHVSDFGKLLVDALESNVMENAALFAAGRAVQLKPVADIVGQVLGIPSRPVRSQEEACLFGPFADALQMNQHFSSERARMDFGWVPDKSDDRTALTEALSDSASHASL